MTLLLNLTARIWNGLSSPLRRELAWRVNPRFIHGVSGIILDQNGRILLLKHRFWKRQRWGLPGGLAHHGETLAETLRRELLEETGMEVRPTKLLRLSTKQHRLAEFVLLAEPAGEPGALSSEIMEARYWEPDALPENLLPAHRRLLEELLARKEWSGMPLEE